ncbi:MAG: hypothetical protein K1X71_20750 [Pirellulales bacterium]|nr:hypothetical protein [Pirellulales bacterium]
MIRAIALAVALLSTSLLQMVTATDFKITSQVYVADREEPVSQNITLFRAGLVYDFLSLPESITIFDARRGLFVLLDPARQVQTEIPTREVAAYNEELKQHALAHKDALLRFLAEPKFQAATPKRGVLELTSPNMTYRVSIRACNDATALRQYQEFSDWYAQLNTVVNPGSAPPFTRIALNRALFERHVLPMQVELTIVPAAAPAPRREVKLLSKHTIAWKISGEDLRRIDEAGQLLTSLAKVSFEEFQRGPEQQPTPQETRKTPEVARQRGAITR